MPIHELFLGRYQDKFADIFNIDSLITDPPYSAKTHSGSVERSTGVSGDYINYSHFEESDCEELVRFFAQRVNNWIVIFGDHVTSKWYEKYLKKVGMYVFAPVYYVKQNAMPRMQGDGPTSSVEVLTRATTEKHLVEMATNILYRDNPRNFELDKENDSVITVARHKVKVQTPKSRPGHYLAKTQIRDSMVAGQKDLETCCQIVKDYSEPGDIVCDPFAGYWTIGNACKILGRTSISCEVSAPRHHLAKCRMREPSQLIIT